jgi:hypothetical protein
MAHADDVAFSQAENDGPVDHTPAPEQLQPMWSAETDLQFFPGTNKVMLTAQRPLMRTVIQNAFDLVQKCLLFDTAFPNPITALELTEDSLIEAASSKNGAEEIHSRLKNDASYMNQMSRLVSLILLIIRLLIFCF